MGQIWWNFEISSTWSNFGFQMWLPNAMWSLLHSNITRVSVTRKMVHCGVILRSGSKVTLNLVSFLQTCQIMGSVWPSSVSYSASSWLISGSLLTRNGVWPQWTLFRVTLTRVFLECAYMQLWYEIPVYIYWTMGLIQNMILWKN